MLDTVVYSIFCTESVGLGLVWHIQHDSIIWEFQRVLRPLDNASNMVRFTVSKRGPHSLSIQLDLFHHFGDMFTILIACTVNSADNFSDLLVHILGGTLTMIHLTVSAGCPHSG